MDAWEIHFLILVSLFLQVFLFLTAGMRKRSTSRILRTVLWLAYLSADSVAIFVLGHLSVRASGPRHQLMLFWAPFVLVHLGGQDTITAFSKQDNELWRRHLLSLVSQVAVAGYVVAKASWHDGRLRAAMVLMFLSGSFKYAERTYCLYSGSPATLRSDHLDRMSPELHKMQQALDFVGGGPGGTAKERARRDMRETLEMMSKGSIRGLRVDRSVSHIMSVDHPLNKVRSILVEDELPGMLDEFLPSANSCGAYEYVGALLVHYYKALYTRNLLRELLCDLYGPFFPPVALVLFVATDIRGQLHATRADIAVSYILLVGAIVLDVSSATTFIFSKMSFNFPVRIMRIASYIRPAWSRKQWSQELGQYSIIKRHIMQDTAGMASIKQWIGKRLGPWGVDLLELAHIPITKDKTPIKEFILDNLLCSGRRSEWNIASSRGQLALQKWMGGHEDQDSARTGKALEKSVRSGADFPTSVLIWHIATEICYYNGDSTSNNSDKLKKDKEVSRELSNYIMYLVFKCNVMLTSNCRLIHDNAHSEIRSILSDQEGHHVNLGEKDAFMKILKSKKEEERQDHSTAEIQKREELASNDNAADNHVEKLRQSAKDLYSPVLPRACEVAQELISINHETDRWRLIAAVWLEMLYYTAPRCGAAFHYEHLTTGGEFATHVLVLMRSLGPFLPPPSAL
ncbi:hypothetical protein ACP70R_029230 [Stipagrostis hirtigluma subsp. patula]